MNDGSADLIHLKRPKPVVSGWVASGYPSSPLRKRCSDADRQRFKHTRAFMRRAELGSQLTAHPPTTSNNANNTNTDNDNTNNNDNKHVKRVIPVPGLPTRRGEKA